MSIQALNWALSQDQIENTGARFVLLVLCNYANEQGQCYPSRETIAQKTSTSVRSVQNHINWLAEHGYLTWTNERNESNRQTPNIYQLKKPSAESALSSEKPSADSAKAECKKRQKPSADSAQYTSEENLLREPVKTDDTYLSGRRGIKRNDLPINPSSDLELQTWLAASAAAFGVKNAHSLPKFNKWEQACMTLVTEDGDMARWLETIEVEKERLIDQPHFFSPDNCLQVYQMNGAKKPVESYNHVRNQPTQRQAIAEEQERVAREIEGVQ